MNANVQPCKLRVSVGISKYMQMISKRHNHHHFWIRDEYLYETYITIRGMRFANVAYVPGMPNEDNCSSACLEYVSKEYFENSETELGASSAEL